MAEHWGYGAQNYFGGEQESTATNTATIEPEPSVFAGGNGDFAPEPDTTSQGTAETPAAHEPASSQDDASTAGTEQAAATEQPKPKPKPKPKTKPKPKPATTKPSTAELRRAVRRGVAAYRGFQAASPQELSIAAILLDTTGKNRLEPEHLATTLIIDGRPDNVDRLLMNAVNETDALDRLVGLAGLDNSGRSRIWRVLSAIDRITGSPAPSDVVGTAKRLAKAIESLSESDIAVLESAKSLLTVN